MQTSTTCLATWARFTPDAEALIDASTDRRWTWRLLHRESLAWAERLRRAGVGEGDLVAVVSFDRAEVLSALFACAELGARVAILPREAPAEGLRRLSPRLVLADGPGARTVGATLPLDAPLLLMDEGPWHIPEDFEGGPAGDHAWLEGSPVLQDVARAAAALELNRSSHTLALGPLSDPMLLRGLVLPTLYQGGRVILQPWPHPVASLALIEDEEVTHLAGRAAQLSALSEAPDFATVRLESLRVTLCCGGGLPVQTLSAWDERAVCVRASWGHPDLGPLLLTTPQAPRTPSDLGLPLHGVLARVVRNNDVDCLTGEVGDLLIQIPGAAALRTGVRAALDHEGRVRRGDKN